MVEDREKIKIKNDCLPKMAFREAFECKREKITPQHNFPNFVNEKFVWLVCAMC